MTHPVDQILAARSLDLARAALLRRGAPRALPSRLLVVDVDRQRAVWFEDEMAKAAWPVSTAHGWDWRRRGVLPDAARLASRAPADRGRR